MAKEKSNKSTAPTKVEETEVIETSEEMIDETVETTEEVAEIEAVVPKQRAITVTPKKTPRLMHYKEFVLGKGLSKGFLAGFKMYLNGVVYLSEEDWNKTLDEYNNRNYLNKGGN